MAEIVDGAVVGTVTQTEVLEAQLAAAKLGDQLRAEKGEERASEETRFALREARARFRLFRAAKAAQDQAEWEAAQTETEGAGDAEG